MQTSKRQLKPKRLMWICMLIFTLIFSLLPVKQLTVQAEGFKIWQKVGDKGFSSGNVEYTTIALDSNNTPYVAYSDSEHENKATVMKHNGSSWETVGNEGFSASGVSYLSIVIDRYDSPYVAFTNTTNKVSVMKYNEEQGSWESVGSEVISSGASYFPTIALDSNGTPYVAHENNGSLGQYKVTVKKYNGSSWEAVGEEFFSKGISVNPTIALGSNDIPYVVYSDAEHDLKATVMKYNEKESSWEPVGNEGFSSADAYRPTIALDSNNTLYVAYIDVKENYKATVMKYNGSSWELLGRAGFTNNSIDSLSIVLDSNNIPYIAFKMIGKTYVMKYDKNGNDWGTLGGGIVSSNWNNSSSIALDSNDSPYVVYRDEEYSNKATVMKFTKALKFSVNAVAASTTPEVGADNEITLTVMDSENNIDTTFSGTYHVTISGYTAASNGSYGSINDTELTADPSTISVTFESGEATVDLNLNHAAAQRVKFSVEDVYEPDVWMSISPVAGSSIEMKLTADIIAPTRNEGAFAQQPVVTLYDVYGNISKGDSSTVVTVSKKDEGAWTLTGTPTATANSGVVSFKDIGANNKEEVLEAQLAFDATNLTQLTSQTVTLPRRPPVVSSEPVEEPVTLPSRPPVVSSEPVKEEKETPVTPEPKGNVFNSNVVHEVHLLNMIEAKVAEAKNATDIIDFTDTKDHWAENTIHTFIKLQLINGYQDGTFRPNSPITRAEFVTLLHRAFNIQGGSNTSIVLKDIGDSWAKQAIENLVTVGVIHGYLDGTFKPDNTITREEMVTILSRVVEMNNVVKDTTKGNFNDLNNAYAAGEIKAAAQAGFISGKSDERFDPKGNATRAEALQIILNVLERNPQLKTLLESLI
ncbi:S-layer homology domain-containing protein [Paenibacillus sp. NPDC057934]|uniref:S-layer homology domain-containing protein n=1 Tax=Paenibacillus sp. NPDC057934 TaxID=3346282 RepID=UPI0036D9CC7F